MMDLELSPDQRELASVARELLDRHARLSLAREFVDGGGDPTLLWNAVAEVGWYAVGLEEDDPFGLPGLCLLAREWGAHVAPGPLVDTAVAIRLAAGLPDGPAPDALENLKAGEATAALAVLEEGADWSLEGLATTAHREGDVYILDGTKLAVPHGARADVIVVIAELDHERTAFFVPADAAGLERTPEPGLDPSTAPARVTLDNVHVPAACAATALTTAELEEALAIGAVATAAEAVGAAAAVLDLSVQYSQERKQFGREIGRFQALQHVMADAHVARETAWSTVLFASAALEDGVPDALESAAIAKAHASRAAREVMEAALQVFGGVAFTWEHDSHLFQRRVLECERRYGDPLHHELVLADLLVRTGAGAVR
jgi:alkylation response protein AidB-like acyl-CoA dehydrogenase